MYLVVGLRDHKVLPVLTFKRDFILFSIGTVLIYILMKRPLPQHSYQHLSSFILL